MVDVASRPKLAPPRQRPQQPTRGAGRFERKLMAPGMLLLAALSIPVTFALVAMSFSTVRLLGGASLDWAGGDNWALFFSDPDLLLTWLRTALFFVLTVGIEMVAGIALALALWRTARGRNALLGALLLPMFVAPAIVGLLGRFLTDSTFGLYSWVLTQLGLSGDVLGSDVGAFVAVTLMDVWEWTPLITLITLAGLAAVPQSVREAAALDGASGWQSLRHVILPSIASVVMVALLIRSMDAIRYFDIIWISTGGGPADATKTASVRLYETAFRFFNFGYAAAIGLVMLVASIIIARMFVRVLDKRGLAR